jgi:hypothetical protein
MSASTFFFVPLSTYNVKDFLKDFTKFKIPSRFQKVFSMQMSSAVGIMIRQKENSYRQRGIQQTSKIDKR